MPGYRRSQPFHQLLVPCDPGNHLRKLRNLIDGELRFGRIAEFDTFQYAFLDAKPEANVAAIWTKLKPF